MSNVIFQPDLFTEHGGKALVQVGKRWYRVPAWLWLEWEAFRQEHSGGIRMIVRDWQGGILMKYRKPDCEDAALDNIEEDSRALLRYYATPHKTTYYDNLDDISRMVLNLDKRLMTEYPQWDTNFRHEKMAKILSDQERMPISVRMVKSWLADAIRMLVIVMERQRLKEIKSLFNAVQAVEMEEKIAS